MPLAMTSRRRYAVKALWQIVLSCAKMPSKSVDYAKQRDDISAGKGNPQEAKSSQGNGMEWSGWNGMEGAGHLLPWLAIALYGMCCMSAAIVVVVRKRQTISLAPAPAFPLAVTWSSLEGAAASGHTSGPSLVSITTILRHPQKQQLREQMPPIVHRLLNAYCLTPRDL